MEDKDITMLNLCLASVVHEINARTQFHFRGKQFEKFNPQIKAAGFTSAWSGNQLRYNDRIFQPQQLADFLSAVLFSPQLMKEFTLTDDNNVLSYWLLNRANVFLHGPLAYQVLLTPGFSGDSVMLTDHSISPPHHYIGKS
jgi:hypothetical protein